jgi:Ca2+-binding EF-hand superfamily protein
VLKNIASIDQDSNGFVTVTELDDILKLQYPAQFGGKDLSSFIRHFRNTQNKALVDYKSMIAFVKSND